MQSSCMIMYRHPIALTCLLDVYSVIRPFLSSRQFVFIFQYLKKIASGSVLSWPAWWRMLVVLPVVALLWLAVWWASLEAAPW